MITRRRRLCTAVAVGLLATLALPACSTRDDTTPPASGASPTPTSEPSSPPVSPPGVPDAAMDKTVDGGVAFVSYYYKLVEYGHLTGKWKPAQKLTDESCEVCEGFWSGPELAKQDEEVLTEVGKPSSEGIEDGRLEVAIVMDVGVGLAGADSEIEKFERATKTWQDHVTLEYSDGWRVVRIEPDQLQPADGCIANRCTGAQKERASGGGQ